MEDRQIDLTSEAGSPSPLGDASSRPFLGIGFACCGTYGRIYANKGQTAYQGHCPRCGRPVQIKIGKEGTSERFFTVY